MKAIIVDDEISAREILKQLLNRHFPEIQVVELCNDVPSAVEVIKAHQPNVVFLDVEMPEYAGYEIVDFFEEVDFQIVFVTAYDEYAIRAFEISAIDYLLKPIEVERLRQAVDKLQKQHEVVSYKKQLDSVVQSLRQSEQKIAYLDKGYRHFVQVKDIVALEAERAYTRVHTAEGKNVLIARNLKQLEDELHKYEQFYRTHRSWLVNLDHFDKYSKTKLEIALKTGLVARLSKQLKPAFEARITS